ncbi:MAG: 2-amino-4-hydroxy-6-hydroxymethyldihydropteridine diphosphokinase [Planctomycetes bacterium]|nr:2-amino-4-hydroxy-6-hydroxymethyldihydropteridine diphosphokinase [Planctomycetota bacterium]
MTRCLLALGSNLGDRAAMLSEATSAVASLQNCQLIARSRWHETTPVGGPEGQCAFLNGVLLLETEVPPQELCEALLRIEAALGRQRAVRWDARAIDIDLLLYGVEKIATPELTVPHPRMSFRRFVLEPAAEIAGAMVHATSGWTVAGLLSHLRAAPRYVAVTSANTAIADWLASQLATELGCPRLEEMGAHVDPQAIESVEDAAALLKQSHWQAVPELSARLPGGQGCDLRGVSPVVSGFWRGTLAAADRLDASPLGCLFAEGEVNPALVIAIDLPANEKFPKKLFSENFEKNVVSQSMSRQEFGELLDRPGIGPLARIQTDDPTVVLQEAVAAVGSAWP